MNKRILFFFLILITAECLHIVQRTHFLFYDR